MDSRAQVLEAMRPAGEPLNAGKIAAISRLAGALQKC
jgi:hypothetical protein